MKNFVVRLTNYGCPFLFSRNTVVREEKSKNNERKLNDKLGAFAIRYDSDYSRDMEDLLNYALEEGLSVVGRDRSIKSYRNIEDIEDGDFITVAASDKFDIDFVINRNNKNYLNNLKTYDIEEDFYEITKALSEVVLAKKKLSKKVLPKKRTYRELSLVDSCSYSKNDRYECNRPERKKEKKSRLLNVEFLPHFIQIDDEIYPKNPNDIYVL